MLEIKVGRGKGGGAASTCTASGDIIEISADVAQVINGIYSQLAHSDPVLAQIFRYNLTKLINDPQNLVWNASALCDGICIIQPKNHKEEI